MLKELWARYKLAAWYSLLPTLAIAAAYSLVTFFIERPWEWGSTSAICLAAPIIIAKEFCRFFGLVLLPTFIISLVLWPSDEEAAP